MAAVTADTLHPHALTHSHDPSAPQPPSNAPVRDDLDSLFAFSDDDAVAAASANPRPNTTANPNTTRSNNDLGIDTEIKVRKQRAPTAKLDETLLLSHKGITSLRSRLSRALPPSSNQQATSSRTASSGRIIKTQKGHEFSSVQKLLQLYQLWADDMFPKARFGDAIAMVEKLGHKKRVQVARREWIDVERRAREGRDESDEDGVDGDGGPDVMQEDGDFVVAGEADAALDGVVSGGIAGAGREDGEEDLYGAPTPPAQTDVAMGTGGNHEPDEDELDALLAEEDNSAGLRSVETTRKDASNGDGILARHDAGRDGQLDDFEDEMDVLAEMGL